jgi:hypothetical protein
MRLLSIDDNLIVPGERVGRVFLGMTEEQLYKRMGTPDQLPPGTGVTNLNGEAMITYIWGDLIAYVQPSTHKVLMIHVQRVGGGIRYATTEGVALGTSELEMKSKLGPPAWGPNRVYTDRDVNQYCFSSGLQLWIDEKHQVSVFIVYTVPACGKEGSGF